MTQPTPTGNFSVQVGAFSDADKAQRAAALARERFTNNVYRFYIKETALFKVLVGDFMTKDEARRFRDHIARQFPDDYKDAWVAPIPYEQK
jgi:cell division septation protein DedD